MQRAWPRAPFASRASVVKSSSVIAVAYLFERFPSFTQTFVYREVMELRRQRVRLTLFSIRRPIGEPSQSWDPEIVRQVHYLPEEPALLDEVKQAMRRGKIPVEAVCAIDQWGRRSDFLRLYQAAHVGMRLPKDIRLHAHFAGMAARTAYWIKLFFGIEYSFTAHANDIFAPRPFAIGLDRLVDSANAVITESDHAASFLKERFPNRAARIHRVYNGLDLSHFLQAVFAPTTPCIISVGRLIEKKGFADLIEACRLLTKKGCNFRCEIVGEGPLGAALRAQIAEGGLESNVQLMGLQTQEQIKKRLADATVFVLPCTTDPAGGTDNLPTVIMEAMAAGLPVVSTPIAGVPEMVEDGVTGELVPPAEPKALADAIERFITNPARARQFGKCGLELARKKFSIEKSVSALIGMLEESARSNLRS